MCDRQKETVKYNIRPDSHWFISLLQAYKCGKLQPVYTKRPLCFQVVSCSSDYILKSNVDVPQYWCHPIL